MVEAEWDWSMQERIPSSKEVGHAAVDQLMAAVAAAGWEGREYFHIQMAASEAVVNAITHGNQESPDKSVLLEFKVGREIVWLRITDEGAGFDPQALPDPRDDDRIGCTNGRGVLLICELMSEVKYNDKGNQVTMLKRRMAPE